MAMGCLVRWNKSNCFCNCCKISFFLECIPRTKHAPDVVLTSSQVGTPRSITSDGNYVMLGDENANGPCIGQQNRTTHIWTSWPTSSRDPDACIENWLAGTIYDSKIYGVAAGGETMYFYDDLYTSTDDFKTNLQTAQPNEKATDGLVVMMEEQLL